MKKVILCWLFLGLLVGGGACLGFSDLFGGSREPGEDEFKCGSSGKIIPKSFLNDDFCDCLEDGSDEPLTGACSNGKFECDAQDPNLLQSLHSSRVNDGICDCCDGSDEKRDDIIVCENTCESKMKILFAEKIEQTERYETGKAIRDQWVKQGQEAKENRAKQIKELEERKSQEEAILEGLEKDQEKEEEEEQKEREQKRGEVTERFREALKLDTLNVDALEEGIVEVVSKRSRATEALIECLSANDVEVDDVAALSSSLAISEGFSLEGLREKEDELMDADNDLERLKRRESPVTRRRHRAEEKLKEAEEEVAREKDREMERLEKEKEKVEEEENKGGDEERMKRVWERLRKLKKRSLKKRAEGFVDDENDDNQFGNPNENLGTIDDSSSLSSALSALSSSQDELQQSLQEWENHMNQKEQKEKLVDILEREIEVLKREEEGKRAEWERENYGGFKKAVGLGGGVKKEVLGRCLWEGVKVGGGSRDLLKFLSKYGVEEQEGLIAPDEPLDYTRESAEAAREKARGFQDMVQDLRRKIEDLEEVSEMDFGEEEEFFVLNAECFDTRVDKYKYEFCFFKNSNQDQTSLGSFDEASWETDKTQMKFLGGRYCMDKDREATVFFECGAKNEILKVSEPERCEYHFFFRTPAACTTPPN